MSEVMKAIRLSQMENELLEIRKKIRVIENSLNSVNVHNRYKKLGKKQLPGLVKRRDSLINSITEESLLHEN